MNYYLTTLVAYPLSFLLVRYFELNVSYLSVGLSLAIYLFTSLFVLKIKNFPTATVILAFIIILQLSNYSNLALVFCTVLTLMLSTVSVLHAWVKK